MNEKLDLARMLREIGEEQETKSASSRPLSQEEIKRMISERKKTQDSGKTDAAEKNGR